MNDFQATIYTKNGTYERAQLQNLVSWLSTNYNGCIKTFPPVNAKEKIKTNFTCLGFLDVSHGYIDAFCDKIAEYFIEEDVWVQCTNFVDEEKNKSIFVSEYKNGTCIYHMEGSFFFGLYVEKQDITRITNIEFDDKCRNRNGNTVISRFDDGQLYYRYFDSNGQCAILNGTIELDKRDSTEIYYLF